MTFGNCYTRHVPISCRRAAFVFAFLTLCLLGPLTSSGTTKTGLSGVVVDPAGGILPGASITVFCLDRAFGTGTNSDGTFEFTELPAGTYTVWVTAKSFASQTIENVQIIDGQTRQITITLKVANPPCFPEASTSYEKKAGDVNLAGKVSEASDGWVSEATIELTRLQSGEKRVTTSGKDGTFQFSGLGVGKYRLQAIRPGCFPFIMDIWITRENLTRISTISLVDRPEDALFIVCQ